MIDWALAVGLAGLAALVVARELRGHARPQWLDNLGIGAVRGLFELATGGARLAVYEGVRHAVPVPALDASSPVTWLLALAGYDFVYYWAHRAQHRSRLLWTVHAVHHQPTEMNVTVGLRTAITNSLAHLPFFSVLAVAGVPTSVYLGVAVAHLLGMAWLHTRRIGTLGRLERWLNTPSLHRVHHSAAPEHADKNFGGLTIVFDRLFGTHAPPEKVERYGLTGASPCSGALGPVAAHVDPWRRLGGATRSAPAEGRGRGESSACRWVMVGDSSPESTAVALRAAGR